MGRPAPTKIDKYFFEKGEEMVKLNSYSIKKKNKNKNKNKI